jgi:hypothetical protein
MRGGDAHGHGVAGRNLAAVDVRRRSVRRQATERCVDLQLFGLPGPALSLRGPSPANRVGGVSLAPERFAKKVIGSAWTAGADSIRAAIMTNAGEGMSALSVMIFLRRHWEDSRRQ